MPNDFAVILGFLDLVKHRVCLLTEQVFPLKRELLNFPLVFGGGGGVWKT